jgi:hypothetical protein
VTHTIHTESHVAFQKVIVGLKCRFVTTFLLFKRLGFGIQPLCLRACAKCHYTNVTTSIMMFFKLKTSPFKCHYLGFFFKKEFDLDNTYKGTNFTEMNNLLKREGGSRHLWGDHA